IAACIQCRLYHSSGAACTFWMAVLDRCSGLLRNAGLPAFNRKTRRSKTSELCLYDRQRHCQCCFCLLCNCRSFYSSLISNFKSLLYFVVFFVLLRVLCDLTSLRRIYIWSQRAQRLHKAHEGCLVINFNPQFSSASHFSYRLRPQANGSRSYRPV